MVIYALRYSPSSKTLTEFTSVKDLDLENVRLAGLGHGAYCERIPAASARIWVKRGGIHETALFVNMDGQVRRASGGEA